MKKQHYSISRKVAYIEELKLRIIDVGQYCYEDHKFFSEKFKSSKVYIQSIDKTILQVILKESFNEINLIFYQKNAIYFKKHFIQEELLRRATRS